MIVLWLVRWRETNISSATATSDSRMISAANGSILLLIAIVLHPCLDDQVADPIHSSTLARVDHSGRGLLFDDGGTLHLFIKSQSPTLEERGVVESVLIEVDLPPTLGCGATRG